MKRHSSIGFHVLLGAVLLLGAVSSGCAGASPEPDDLPVSRVVLYQNGIGYFERYGTFEGKELKLRIRPDQINDILGSLTVIDLNKGGAASVSLPVEKNSQMVLGELPDQVRNAGGLVSVLQAFRGADVDISTSKGSVSGRIVGVESYGEDGSRVTVLSDEELVPVKLDDITEVQIEDRTLTVGLEKALDVALGDGAWKPVEVVVHFPEGGKHKILMSYVVAMPTWKPAYRLVFGKEEGKARLQGWAVVDNVSGEDWREVDLSLTAGAPISFIVDLHTPRLPSRPDLTGRTYNTRSQVPPEALGAFGGTGRGGGGAAEGELGLGLADDDAPMAKEAERRRSSSRGDMAPAPRPAPAPSMDAGMMDGSVGSGVSGEQVGALFRYDVPLPVTVPDSSSALVTIVNDDIDGEDVLYFDPTGSAQAQQHPYSAVRMTNTTDVTLERGPLNIYKDGTFVGSGIASQIKAGQSTFIPYQLEPSVHIERAYDYGNQEQKLVKVRDGVATVESYQLQTVNFTITSHLNEDRSVFLRVDKSAGYELREPKEAIEQGQVYFVKMQADASGVTKHKVVQAQRTKRTIALFDPGMKAAIELYIADADADPKVKAQLEAIIGMQRERADLERRRKDREKRQADLRRRAADLRQNIKVLSGSKTNAKLRDELVEKLGGVEDELAEIDRELVELGEKRYALEVRMSEAFNAITLE